MFAGKVSGRTLAWLALVGLSQRSLSMPLAVPQMSEQAASAELDRVVDMGPAIGALSRRTFTSALLLLCRV